MAEKNNKQQSENNSCCEHDNAQHEIEMNEQVNDASEKEIPEEESGAVAVDEKKEPDLNEELEKLRREKEETVNLLQRVQADFDNFRKRTTAEKEEIRAYALFDFICKVIPVLDNLERAMESGENKEVPQSYIDGLDMIRRQINQLLEQQGVSPIEAEGCIFDPHYHEAVMQTEEGDGEPHSIVEELQRGYVMKDRVLRPAMVKVYTGGGSSSETEE